MHPKIFPVRVLLYVILLITILILIFIISFGYSDLPKKVLASFTKRPTAIVVEKKVVVDSEIPQILVVEDKKIVVPSKVSPQVSLVSISLPIRLVIPAIKVDANVLHLGLTADGAMDAPKGPSDVSWYNLGPRPGEIGSAVVAGHYGGWKDGSVSVFQDLTKIQKGDKVSIKNKDGSIITFVVRETRNFDSKADASDVFLSTDGKSHLNIITCEGVWNGVEKSYSNRFVVFTDREY